MRKYACRRMERKAQLGCHKTPGTGENDRIRVLLKMGVKRCAQALLGISVANRL